MTCHYGTFVDHRRSAVCDAEMVIAYVKKILKSGLFEILMTRASKSVVCELV